MGDTFGAGDSVEDGREGEASGEGSARGDLAEDRAMSSGEEGGGGWDGWDGFGRMWWGGGGGGCIYCEGAEKKGMGLGSELCSKILKICNQGRIRARV